MMGSRGKVGKSFLLVLRTDEGAQDASLGSEFDDLRVLVGIDRVDGQLGASRVDFLWKKQEKPKPGVLATNGSDRSVESEKYQGM